MYLDNKPPTFTYNPDNSLSQKVLYNSSNSVLNSWAYSYDAVNHILQETTPSLTTYYQYDNANRVCYYSTSAAPPQPPNQCQNPTYTYDADGNRLRDSFGNSFTNNADGSINQVNGGAPFTYTPFQALQSDGASHNYDGFDRMTSSGSNSYQYDALDRQRSANGTTVNYDGFSQTPAIETVSGSDRIYALDPFGRPKGVQNGGSSQYLTDDGHGNVGATTNGSQSMTCSTQYDPWGRPPTGQATPCTGGGSTDSDLFYRSFRRDAATGTYQFGSRTYDPTKAGFLSSDVYRAESASKTQGLQLAP